MFNGREIKKVNDKLNSLPKPDNNTKKEYPDAAPIIAKITGVVLDTVNKLYRYSWKGIKFDGTDDSNIGQSGPNTTAICLQEIGQDMSARNSITGVDCVVLIYRSINGCVFNVPPPIIDIKYDKDLNLCWYVKLNGDSVEVFKTTIHDHAIPIIGGS